MTPDVVVIVQPAGLPGANGIVGDMAWNTGSAVLLAQENLGGFAVSKPFTASAGASVAVALGAPSVDVVFSIYSFVAGVSTLIGTVSFAAASNDGVIVFLPGLSLIAEGAVIYIVAPTVPDIDLILVSITIASL